MAPSMTYTPFSDFPMLAGIVILPQNECNSFTVVSAGALLLQPKYLYDVIVPLSTLNLGYYSTDSSMKDMLTFL